MTAEVVLCDLDARREDEADVVEPRPPLVDDEEEYLGLGVDLRLSRRLPPLSKAPTQPETLIFWTVEIEVCVEEERLSVAEGMRSRFPVK